MHVSIKYECPRFFRLTYRDLEGKRKRCENSHLKAAQGPAGIEHCGLVGCKAGSYTRERGAVIVNKWVIASHTKKLRR